MLNLDFDTGTEVLRAAAEPTRLRLLSLCARGEHSVGDLAGLLQQSQPRISRHLKILVDAGLLERFRDGSFAYFRVPASGPHGEAAMRLLELFAPDDPTLAADAARLAGGEASGGVDDLSQRQLNRAILDLFLSHPVGALLDVGMGSGNILKLLSGKASRAVGVDIDPARRRAARRALARADLRNCTVRQADMYALPFDTASFDTVVLDELLLEAERPGEAFAEAARVLAPGGRVLLIDRCGADEVDAASRTLAAAAREAGARCSPFRRIATDGDRFLIGVATHVRDEDNDTHISKIRNIR
jgi:ArsR family transcriptional regulator